MKVFYKEEFNYIKVYFDKMPDRKTIDSLKLCGWRWIPSEKCWRNFSNEENRNLAKSLYQETHKDDKDSFLKQYTRQVKIISINNLVIRLDTFACGKNHTLQDMTGKFQVFKTNGKVDFILAPIAFCKECNRYYILNETVKEIRKKGVILCQMVKKEQLSEMVDSSKWNEVGLLKSYGYSVNASDDLSDVQRQQLLTILIDKRIVSKAEILSRLDWFCKMRGNDLNSSAVTKWKEDRKFIANYRLGTDGIVHII